MDTIKQEDLSNFPGSSFNGLTVGVGSLVFLFSGKMGLTIQCQFECYQGKDVLSGHGEDLSTAPFLFDFLNETVTEARLGKGNSLILSFGKDRSINIIPDHLYPESYVLHNGKDIIPVS